MQKLFVHKKTREIEKPHGENPSSKMEMEHNLNEYLYFIFFLNFNKLYLLLFGEKLCRVVVDALIIYHIFNDV